MRENTHWGHEYGCSTEGVGALVSELYGHAEVADFDQIVFPPMHGATLDASGAQGVRGVAGSLGKKDWREKSRG